MVKRNKKKGMKLVVFSLVEIDQFVSSKASNGQELLFNLK